MLPQRRYSFVDHAVTRLTALLLVAVAVGPVWRDARADELERLEGLAPDAMLEAVRPPLEAGALELSIWLFVVGAAGILAVEGLAFLLRSWVIPRA